MHRQRTPMRNRNDGQMGCMWLIIINAALWLVILIIAKLLFS